MTDHMQQIQDILLKTHTEEELNKIIAERKAWVIESHASGAYGTAREQALTFSLASQLRDLLKKWEAFNKEWEEFKEDLRTADHHDAMEN